MIRRPALTAVVIASALLLGQNGQAANVAQPSPGWTAPFSQDGAYDARPPVTPQESMQYPTGSSAAVLPDGRVVYWNGLPALEDSTYPLAVDAGVSGGKSDSRVLDLKDPAHPVWTKPSPSDGGSDDMFCSDQRLLSDGRLIVAGGTYYSSDPVDIEKTSPEGAAAFKEVTGQRPPGGTAELFGSSATRIFQNDTWTQAGSMHKGRWYPTVVTMPDGRLFVASGVGRLLYNTTGVNVAETEIFDPATNEWTLTGDNGSTSLPLFARLHLLPSGKVFYDGTGQMWSPFGQSADESTWNLHKVYDPAGGPEATWDNTGVGSFGARSSAFSVPLPLKPDANGNYNEAKFLIGGGTLGVTPSTFVATPLTEIVSVSEDANGVHSSSVQAASMNNRRWYSSGVLLPNGNVVALSGADKDEVIAPGSELPVREAEMWNAATNTWSSLGKSGRDRTYHNSAILLADGSILVGGHAPINQGYGAKGDSQMSQLTGGIAVNNLKDPSFEILHPSYFDQTRPQIKKAPAGITWRDGEASFEVEVSDAAPVDKMVLMRLPSTTHITDADMRSVELPFTNNGGELTVQAPPNSSVVPPGFYYLFAMSNGVPSKAHIVQVAGSGLRTGTAPAPMGI